MNIERALVICILAGFAFIILLAVLERV